jgi:hypothetical protein
LHALHCAPIRYHATNVPSYCAPRDSSIAFTVWKIM